MEIKEPPPFFLIAEHDAVGHGKDLWQVQVSWSPPSFSRAPGQGLSEGQRQP